jgi:hypothetical protein
MEVIPVNLVEQIILPILFVYFRYSTQAKMVDTGTGNLYIVGSFKRMSPDPDFKVRPGCMHVTIFDVSVCASAKICSMPACIRSNYMATVM